jgi:uncharacterized protein (DUF433 family)
MSKLETLFHAHKAQMWLAREMAVEHCYSMSVGIDSLINCAPHGRASKPHIAGTGITVHRIVRWYKQGYSAEQIAGEYSHLTLAQVYAALSYYHANQTEIEADLSAEDEEIDGLEQHSRPGSAV